MISVPGTINIAERHGRFGSFNVGTLECSIGSFTVKDSSIDEFEPGIYHGDFVIEKIKPLSYLAGSRLVVEVRATLSAILLSGDAEPLPVHYESLERDPIEEDQESNDFYEPRGKPARRSQRHREAPMHEATASTVTYLHVVEEIPLLDTPDSFDADAANLFGLLWPIGRVVKLDPTIDRGVFRQQKDYLKNNGYRFMATEQNWVKEG